MTMTQAERGKLYRQRHPEKSREATRKWKEKNKEKVRERARKAARLWRQRHPEQHRAYQKEWLQKPGNLEKKNRREHLHRIKVKYGLSSEDYLCLLKEQEGVCAVNNCGRQISHVDHDHVTGKVRGLLCKQCNWTLGHTGDSIERLRGLIEYLSN